MTHDELRDYIDKFDAAGMVNEPTVKALRAVIEACKSWEDQRVIPISYVLGAIDKELR